MIYSGSADSRFGMILTNRGNSKESCHEVQQATGICGSPTGSAWEIGSSGAPTAPLSCSASI